MPVSRGAQVTDCGKWLLVFAMKDCRDNLVFLTKLDPGSKIEGKLPLTKVVDKLEADYEVGIIMSSVTYRGGHS